MLHTIDAQSTFGEALLSVHQESLIDGFLVNVAFHVNGGLLLFIVVDEAEDYFQGCWIVFALTLKFLRLALWYARIAAIANLTTLLGGSESGRSCVARC